MGRGCTVGLGRAIEFLNAQRLLEGGSSRMSDLIASFGFLCGTASSFSSTSTENRISKWAFEVADTVAQGVRLFHSLSKENTQFLKDEIFHSKGVQELVSKDTEELLGIAAADMREKLDVFFEGVIRFGNLCRDSQWHNLDLYFSNLQLDYPNHEQIRVEAEITVQELSNLVDQINELYSELNILNSIEHDYLHKRGRNVETWRIDQIAKKEGLVRSLKKESLWSRKFEEIVGKLVDVATYIHLTISEAFESNGRTLIHRELSKIPQRLGKSDLHYAYIISEIGNILSDYVFTGIKMKNLYLSLPSDVKTSLHSRLQSLNVKEELAVSQIKTEMRKTLQWLVPLVENTERACVMSDGTDQWSSKEPFRLQTLCHADKHKTDECIVELMIWLHRFINTLAHNKTKQIVFH